MVDLYFKVREMKTLVGAWRVVKASALVSSSDEIKSSAVEFESESNSKLRTLQAQLRKQTFMFKNQKGVAKKRAGKEPRPLVISPIENRIVQRAILDVMQSNVPYIDTILNVPTSFGGIKGKRVEMAIMKLKDVFSGGAKYYIRSDIPNFFTKVKRSAVLEEVRKHVQDEKFYELFSSAIETTLGNLSELGRQNLSKYFPVGLDGVAQGSPLSPLIANIYLEEFDREMNSGTVACIRYVDDFVILGATEKDVFAGFRRAEAILKRLGLTAYSPFTATDKAGHGRVGDGFDFLGCHVTPGLVQPSRAARNSLLDKVDAEVLRTLSAAKHIMEGGELVAAGCYGQGLSKINSIVWGWGKSFYFCNGFQVAKNLDLEISKKLGVLERELQNLIRGADYRVRQRVSGVNLLEDIFRPDAQKIKQTIS